MMDENGMFPGTVCFGVCLLVQTMPVHFISPSAYFISVNIVESIVYKRVE